MTYAKNDAKFSLRLPAFLKTEAQKCAEQKWGDRASLGVWIKDAIADAVLRQQRQKRPRFKVVLSGLTQQELDTSSRSRRVVLSIQEHEYVALQKLSEHYKSNMQHFIISLLRGYLLGGESLLGSEIEELRESNRALWSMNSALKSLMRDKAQGHDVGYTQEELAALQKLIKEHTKHVGDVLTASLNRCKIEIK